MVRTIKHSYFCQLRIGRCFLKPYFPNCQHAYCVNAPLVSKNDRLNLQKRNRPHSSYHFDYLSVYNTWFEWCLNMCFSRQKTHAMKTCVLKYETDDLIIFKRATTKELAQKRSRWYSISTQRLKVTQYIE